MAENNINSPVEPLKDSEGANLGSQQENYQAKNIMDPQETKISVFEIASSVQDALKHLMDNVEESDKEVHRKLDQIAERLSHLEKSVATESTEEDKS